MFRTLVVPLDGSKLAEVTLPYAVQLVQTGNGRLVLVRVATAPVPDRIDGMNWQQDKVDAVAEAEHYLSAVAKSVDVQVEIVAPFGRAANEILKVIEDYAADGVVMATHGRTGLPHLLVGSVAETLLGRSPVPLFLVHAGPNEEPTAPFDPLVARLLVPLDGSSFAEMALQPAIRFLGVAGELVLVCITQPPKHVIMDNSGQRVVAYLDQQVEAHTREALDYLNTVAKDLRATYPGMHVSTHARLAEEPGSGIVQAAAERAADLVVMATHGRTGVQRAVLGSVAGKVLRTGSRPLLLVGPGAQYHQALATGDAYEVARR